MNDKPPPRFELETFHRDVSDGDLVADLMRVSEKLGKKKVTFRDYNKTGKFNSSTIATRFGSWHGALERAGLEKTVERNISSEALFRNIVVVWSKLGRHRNSETFPQKYQHILPQHMLTDLEDGGMRWASLLIGQTTRMFRWSPTTN